MSLNFSVFSCKITCNVGDLGSLPGLGRSPGEGKDYPLQYSDLENSKDHIVHGVAKSRIRLRDFHFHFIHPTNTSAMLTLCQEKAEGSGD